MSLVSWSHSHIGSGVKFEVFSSKIVVFLWLFICKIQDISFSQGASGLKIRFNFCLNFRPKTEILMQTNFVEIDPKDTAGSLIVHYIIKFIWRFRCFALPNGAQDQNDEQVTSHAEFQKWQIRTSCKIVGYRSYREMERIGKDTWWPTMSSLGDIPWG